MYVGPRYLLVGRGRVGGSRVVHQSNTPMPIATTMSITTPSIDRV
jgi:hypothetical protein